MLDWEPPFAAAAAAGRPIPSVEQLRQEAAARVTARDQELLAGDQDPLPPASGDEVMIGRLLEGSFYEGGVKDTLKRRAQQAAETAGGGGAATLAAAAMTANVEAAEVAGEAALLAADAGAAAAAAVAGPGDGGSSSGSSAGMLSLLGGGSGGGGADSLREAADRWPWPTVEEVLDEASVRRAAQRVWVLMGGDGPGRQQALRSGANIWAKLQRCCDLQVGEGLCDMGRHHGVWCGGGCMRGERVQVTGSVPPGSNACLTGSLLSCRAVCQPPSFPCASMNLRPPAECW